MSDRKNKRKKEKTKGKTQVHTDEKDEADDQVTADPDVTEGTSSVA